MTEPLIKVYVGVEVASAKLDLATSNHVTLSGLPPQVPNQPTAITRWLRTLPPDVHLVCESTGPYHLALLRACWQRGVTVSRVNPEQVRAFANSRRLFAKTDRLDARLLADFAAALTPPPTHAPEPGREQLRELHTRRAQLVAVRADELKRQEQPGLGKVATASLRRTIAGLTREITKLEVAADQLVDQSQELHHFRAVLMSPQGVGALTATAPPSRNSAKSPARASPALTSTITPLPLPKPPNNLFLQHSCFSAGESLTRKKCGKDRLQAPANSPSVKGNYSAAAMHCGNYH